MEASETQPSRSTRPPRAGVVAQRALALAGAILALSSSGAARAAEQTLRFEPIGDYELEIDGKVVPDAKMFHSPEAQAVLVMTPALSHPIAVVPRPNNKTVQRLDPAELTKEPAGSIAWKRTGTPTAVGTFELVDSKPVFELDGKKIRFLDKGPLLGPRTREEIFAFDPSYPYRAATADPPTVYLDVINTWPQEVVVKIFFSTQCQVCRDLLPGVFKTIDRIKNPRMKFEFYGMPLPASKDPLAGELKITDFPTGILYTEGKEIGRASGHTWRMPDLAIHNALRGITVNPDAIRVEPGTPLPGQSGAARPARPAPAPPRQP
jgi:hypothetical protein